MRRTIATGVAAALAMAMFMLVGGGARDVGADTAGGFSFTPPAGWQKCDVMGKGFEAQFCNPKGAVIAVKAPLPQGDIADLLRAAVKGADVLKDQAVGFAGQKGHMVIARMEQKGKEPIMLAIAGTGASGGAMVFLGASATVVEEAAAAWAGVIDSGTLGKAAAPARKFTVKNASKACEATVMIDGRTVKVAPGGSAEVELAEGEHEFAWVETDGSKKSARAAVPPALSLTASCVTGGGAPPPVLGGGGSGGGEGAIFDGARAMVSFYRLAWNIVLDGEAFDVVPKSIDRLMLRVVAARPKERRGELAGYTGYLQRLQAADQRTKGKPEARKVLRRATFLLLYTAGQAGVPDACAPKGDGGDALVTAIDCTVDALGAKVRKDPANLLVEMGIRFERLGVAEDPAELMATIDKLGQ